MAHGTHGIHGKGDERREPRKRKGAEFFTTKDATGVGRGPEKLPANCAKGREWRRGRRRIGDGIFYHETHERHESPRGGGREAEKLPADLAEGREWGKRVRGVGAVLLEWPGTCGLAELKRVPLRWARRLGLEALSKLTVAPKGAVGLR